VVLVSQRAHCGDHYQLAIEMSIAEFAGRRRIRPRSDHLVLGDAFPYQVTAIAWIHCSSDELFWSSGQLAGVQAPSGLVGSRRSSGLLHPD
jgi:hypothetical protein